LDIKASVIIPSRDGYREGKVPKLLNSLKEQTFQDFEVHLVKGESRQGRAINKGARLAKGGILIILDDDAQLGSRDIFMNIVRALDRDKTIGMAGVSIIASPDASDFQKRLTKEIPRTYFPVVEKITDSDMAQHGCCAIPKKVFFDVGQEDESMMRGLDPLLRYKIRKAGYRVVIVPDSWIYHTIADNYKQLVRKMFRNGIQAYWTYSIRPEAVIETPEDGAPGRGFSAKRPRAYRAIRSLARLILSLFTFRLLAFSARVSYMSGYLYAMLLKRSMPA